MPQRRRLFWVAFEPEAVGRCETNTRHEQMSFSCIRRQWTPRSQKGRDEPLRKVPDARFGNTRRSRCAPGLRRHCPEPSQRSGVANLRGSSCSSG